jgi:Kdo2-lipid IVA lauroyltransferase/acyltransferase
MKYRLSHIAEFAALQSVGAVFSVLPYRAALVLAWGLAKLFHLTARSRVQEAQRRIRCVLGEETPADEVRRIAWTSCRNLFFNAVEMFRAPRIDTAWISSFCECSEAIQVAQSQVSRGGGAVVAVPHMGNWEMAGVVCHRFGLPIFSIAAVQKNPLTNRYLNRIRSATGIEVIERGTGTMKDVLRNLRAGKMLAILPDVRMRTEGVATPFLGGTANLGPGMALFARHANVPVLPGVVCRVGWLHHQFRALQPVYPDIRLDKEADVARITREVMSMLEREIRKQPEQWFWYNKRWVLDPIEKSGQERKGR